jgi:hypothetical protein
MVISSLEEHYLRAGSACQMTLTIPQTGRRGYQDQTSSRQFLLLLNAIRRKRQILIKPVYTILSIE